MAVVIQPGYSPTRPLTHARIGHATITRTGTLSASGEQTGFEADSALNALTYEFWKADALPATWRIDAGSAVSVDYFGIAAHTIGTDGASVKPQWSDDDSAWNDLDVEAPAWDIGSAGKFEASASNSGANGLFLKSDGTKLYVISSSTDLVYQYPLSTAWDVSSIGAVEDTFSVLAEESEPQDLFFKDDGTKLYIVGTSNDQVRQYPLSTAWDLTTVGALEASFSVATEESSPQGLSFSSDGTKLYVVGIASDQVRQYPLSAAWDVSTAGAVEASFSVASEDTLPRGLFFKSDGKKLYVLGDSTNTVYQYSLSTAWDVSTAGTVEASFSVGTEQTAPLGLFIKPDGLKLYSITTGIVHQYPILLADDSPILFLFASESHRYWRIRVTGSTTPSIGVVYIGSALAMTRPIYGGHSPIDLSRQTIVRPQKSEGGQWIGRSIVRTGYATSFDWQHLSPSFIRDEFDPFIEDARIYPFFLAWRPGTFPIAAYCWTGQDIQPSNMGIGKGLMSVSLSVEGLGVD